MPVSALFLLMMGAGGFLLYAAVKGEHPWSLFTTTLSGSVPAPNSVAGSAPYTGVINPHTGLAQGVSVGPGESLHG